MKEQPWEAGSVANQAHRVCARNAIALRRAGSEADRDHTVDKGLSRFKGWALCSLGGSRVSLGIQRSGADVCSISDCPSENGTGSQLSLVLASPSVRCHWLV